MKRCPNCTALGPCHVVPLCCWSALICAGGFALSALIGGCHVKPLPVSPEMRCEFDPGCDPTPYPPLDVGNARDAGADR